MHSPVPTKQIQRRDFLKAAGLAAAAGGLGTSTVRRASAAEPSSRMIKKAVKIGMVAGEEPLLDKFRMLKELDFDGVDMNAPTNLNREEVIEARDKSGLVIHGVVDSVHWRDTLSHPDSAVRARGVEALEKALHDSKFYGGTTVLLVPAVVNKEVSYDEAYRRSQTEIRKVLPLAKELGIKIGIENVWNQFLLSPLEMARYIDEFDSEMIGVYFDIGNVVAYGWPEHWIRILGKRIVKLDIKEYSRKLQQEEGTYKGFRVKLGDGDCDWPAVMDALRAVGYRGWGTAEVSGGNRDRLHDISQRMDRCFAS